MHPDNSELHVKSSQHDALTPSQSRRQWSARLASACVCGVWRLSRNPHLFTNLKFLSTPAPISTAARCSFNGAKERGSCRPRCLACIACTLCSICIAMRFRVLIPTLIESVCQFAKHVGAGMPFLQHVSARASLNSRSPCTPSLGVYSSISTRSVRPTVPH